MDGYEIILCSKVIQTQIHKKSHVLAHRQTLTYSVHTHVYNWGVSIGCEMRGDRGGRGAKQSCRNRDMKGKSRQSTGVGW